MKDVQGLLIYQDNEGNLKIRDVKYGPEDICPLIDCSHFDIAVREIAGIYYDFYIDDDGAGIGYPTVMFEGDEDFLFGNVLISKADGKGANIGLSDDDISIIKSKLRMLKTSYSNLIYLPGKV